MRTKKTALITGASRGIGKSIAIELAQHGYDLYLTCKTNIEFLKNLKLGGQVLCFIPLETGGTQ